MPANLPPSIFNDVVGPVMRGPSSSHSAAALRIGRLARGLCGGTPTRVLFEADTQGSLPTTHDTQGSDMGLFGGLLGWEADDERLKDATRHLREAGVDLEMRFARLDDPHPNTYRLTCEREGMTWRLVAISTGGGMIETVAVDGAQLRLFGDYEVALVRCADEAAARALIAEHGEVEAAQCAADDRGSWLVALSSRMPFDGDSLPAGTRHLPRVLPVGSRKDLAVPFLHAGEMLAHGGGDFDREPLSRWALEYECARGGLSEREVLGKMQGILEIVRGGVREGLAGTSYPGRVLPSQSPRFHELWQQGKLLDAGMLNRMLAYVTALMEVKSSMGVFVAAPTAGSCATFPGTIAAAADALDVDDDRVVRAMLSSGLIGVFVATRSSFAAEVGGCQAETGAGAAMAAAALVELAGGSAHQSLGAASHALQNVLGLVCDPVANRVEAPCLGRNVNGAANALVCANMALAGYLHLIPLDEVLDAHREVSERMARELRCTALGGLSITPTSKAIEARMAAECGGGTCGSC